MPGQAREYPRAVECGKGWLNFSYRRETATKGFELINTPVSWFTP
jgi:hypothetical protein